MSSVPRVQLSLTFENLDYYYNYVKPVKDNREITPLVMRLLEAYFMDMNVQKAVDAYGLEDVGIDDMVQGEFNDALTKAKETLAMMSVLSESAKDVISDGMMNIEDMVSQVDELHSAMGEPQSDSEEANVDVPRIDISSDKFSSGDNARLSQLETSVAQLSSDITELKDMFKHLFQTDATQVGSVDLKDSMQSETVDVPNEESNEVEDNLGIFDEDEIEPDVTSSTLDDMQSVVSIEDDTVLQDSGSPVVEDVKPLRRSASDILADITATLGETEFTPSHPAIKAPIEEASEESSVEEPVESTPIDGTSSLMSFLSDF